ncbi:hypothetical protein FRB94_014129 [Tulasnella sp. JGI-2019a]|nr:hypothetical protein FRB94_014129 [Tulasnella sp. JGI-2019a]
MLMLAHSALKGARLEPQQAHLAKDNGVQHRTFHGRTTSPYEKDKSTGPRLFSVSVLKPTPPLNAYIQGQSSLSVDRTAPIIKTEVRNDV